MTTDTDSLTNPNPERHWQNRRRMAWLSLFGVFGCGALAAIGITPADSVPLLQTVVWALTGIVAVYSGGACMVDAMARLKGA